MNNIELKKIEGIYYSIDDVYEETSIYINLDLVLRTNFNIIEEDFEIDVYKEYIHKECVGLDINNVSKKIIKKGSFLITLDCPMSEYPIKILIDKDKINEYHRLHRILTEKFCVK